MDSKNENPFQQTARERYLGLYAMDLGFNEQQLVEWVERSDGTVIDFGTGSGGVVKEFETLTGKKNLLIGFDKFPFEKGQGFRADSVFLADFSHLPFGDNSISGGLSDRSLGWYAESEQQLTSHLEEVFRVLKPGALFRMSMNGNSVNIFLKKAVGTEIAFIKPSTVPSHDQKKPLEAHEVIFVNIETLVKELGFQVKYLNRVKNIIEIQKPQNLKREKHA